MGKKKEAIEIICPKCRRTQIIHAPKEEIPKCPECNTQMVIREILIEGKSC
jgi:ssDNA-binding Zn-finger/Zn-ribbon topoisomerase 1